MKPTFWTPWLNGIPEAAAYAHLRESEMRRLVKGKQVKSRKKPKNAEGKRPRGVLVWAPSIDQLIDAQPSGASEVAEAMASASTS